MVHPVTLSSIDQDQNHMRVEANSTQVGIIDEAVDHFPPRARFHNLPQLNQTPLSLSSWQSNLYK